MEKYESTGEKSDCITKSEFSSPVSEIETNDLYLYPLKSSDLAVFETLSEEHIVTDLSVCYSDEHITFL